MESHKARPKSALPTRPRSQSDIPVPLSRSISTISGISPSKQVKRLSIDSELAQAHRDIIALSRASPIERAEAELIRRKSWSEAIYDPEQAEVEEEEAFASEQEEEEEELEESSVRKIDGTRPTIAHVESEEEQRLSSRRAMKQSDLLQRPASSLAITSSRLGMMLRRSVSTQRKHDIDYGKPAGYAGVADKEDVETVEERSKKARGGSNMQRSSIPMKASATGRRSTSRRSLSMSTGRNVVHKGARQLTAFESGHEGSDAVVYLDANEVSSFEFLSVLALALQECTSCTCIVHMHGRWQQGLAVQAHLVDAVHWQ